MQFPDDPTLIARGKYSTLGRERRKQLERVQSTCATVMSLCHHALKGSQMDEPDVTPIGRMSDCVKNLEDAAKKISDLNTEMNALKPEAWQ